MGKKSGISEVIGSGGILRRRRTREEEEDWVKVSWGEEWDEAARAEREDWGREVLGGGG